MKLELDVSISGTVTVVHQVVNDQSVVDLITKLGVTMSQLGDDIKAKIAAASTAADKTLADVTTEVAGLNSQIAALTAQVAAGGLEPQEVTDIESQIDALTAKVAAADPTSPVVVPPAPAPQQKK